MEEGPESGMDLDEADFLPAAIENISVSNLGFIVFLKLQGVKADGRVLPIFIGPNEAHAIAIAYNNQVPPRPLTHDLMKNILGLLDCEITKVQVTALADNTFYGRVFLRKEGIEEIDIDARPSDALALALRYKAPIFVHKDVYESAAIEVKGESQDEAPAEGPGEGAGDPAGESPEATSGKSAEPENPAKSAGPVKASAPLSPVERLKEKLRKALEWERYEEAARLRDELKRLESGN